MRAFEFNLRDAVQFVFEDVFPSMSDKEVVRPPVVQRQVVISIMLSDRIVIDV